MKLRIFAFGIAIAMAVTLSPLADTRADILVSNLTEPFRSDTPIGNPEYWGGPVLLYQQQSRRAAVDRSDRRQRRQFARRCR